VLVSIIVPFFNEQSTLGTQIERALAAPLPPSVERELLLIDDGSTDGSRAAATSWAERAPGTVRSITLPENQGKGAAVRAGIAAAQGEICLVQDADLEYDPADYAALIAAFTGPEVAAVYGSRILGSPNRSYDRYYWGGRLVSWWTSVLYGRRITDEATGYKVFRRDVALGLDLRARRFEFCAELTGKLLRSGARIVEIPIHYTPRSFAEGKKIRPSDGLIALWTLLSIRLGLDRHGPH
jgi:glycosyltransferase involved in cell wall biosynthesis